MGLGPQNHTNHTNPKHVKGPGPDRLGFGLGGQGSWAGPAWFWLGGQGSWAGPAWFWLGGPRVLGRAGLAFIFRLGNAFISRLDKQLFFA